jgi:predicted N-acetyltransferase YhbS
MEIDQLSCRDLVAQWNRCHGAFFQVRESDLLWHLQDQDWLSYSVEDCAGVPVLLAAATASGVAAGLSAKTLWLSLHGEMGNAESFVSALDLLAPRRGKSRLTIGGEDFHLIPGSPDPPEPSIGPALERRGFCLSPAADFAGELKTEAIRSYVKGAQIRAAEAGWSLGVLESATELDELGSFLTAEFPGRWEREFRFWRSRSDTRRACWTGLRLGGKAIRGFARLALRGGSEGGWIPGALRLPVAATEASSAADSCLGPIGVAAAERGKGAGRILLGLSLEILLAKGAERVCIDWTNAYNYYQPLGLTAVRTYRSAWKDY